MTKPFVLFDLGETLVDLKELLVSLAANLASKYPALRPELPDRASRCTVAEGPRRPEHVRLRFPPGPPGSVVSGDGHVPVRQADHRCSARAARRRPSGRGPAGVPCDLARIRGDPLIARR